MKIILKGLVIFTVVFLLNVHIAQAQLIDWNRRNKNQGAAQPQAARTVPKATVTASKAVKAEAMAGDVEAKNRFEQRYDANGDGKLQLTEQTVMLKDVVSGVERYGRYFISSPLLDKYDEDGDGYISQEEVGAIQKVIGK